MFITGMFDYIVLNAYISILEDSELEIHVHIIYFTLICFLFGFIRYLM